MRQARTFGIDRFVSAIALSREPNVNSYRPHNAVRRCRPGVSVLARCVIASSLSVLGLGGPVIAESAETIIQTDTGSKTLYSESYALIVAQSNYAHWDHLNSATDSTNLRSALEDLGFEERNIRVVPDVKSADLLGVFQHFLGEPAHARPDVRLLTDYAGHGDTLNHNSYLVPVDAPPEGESRLS